MLGAIIGDIEGSRFEFNPTNDYHFELFGEGCSFTDDTVCTIAIADALLKGKDFGESLHEWCNRYPNPMGGYGGRFRAWVMNDEPLPYNSFGNGSAMRVSAIGHWFEDEKIIKQRKLLLLNLLYVHQVYSLPRLSRGFFVDNQMLINIREFQIITYLGHQLYTFLDVCYNFKVTSSSLKTVHLWQNRHSQGSSRKRVRGRGKRSAALSNTKRPPHRVTDVLYRPKNCLAV